MALSAAGFLYFLTLFVVLVSCSGQNREQQAQNYTEPPLGCNLTYEGSSDDIIAATTKLAKSQLVKSGSVGQKSKTTTKLVSLSCLPLDNTHTHQYTAKMKAVEKIPACDLCIYSRHLANLSYLEHIKSTLSPYLQPKDPIQTCYVFELPLNTSITYIQSFCTGEGCSFKRSCQLNRNWSEPMYKDLAHVTKENTNNRYAADSKLWVVSGTSVGVILLLSLTSLLVIRKRKFYAKENLEQSIASNGFRSVTFNARTRTSDSIVTLNEDPYETVNEENFPSISVAEAFSNAGFDNEQSSNSINHEVPSYTAPIPRSKREKQEERFNPFSVA